MLALTLMLRVRSDNCKLMYLGLTKKENEIVSGSGLGGGSVILRTQEAEAGELQL